MNKYRQLRTNANLTLDEAVAKLEITKGTLYQIETGHKKPGIKLKFRMCEVYKCRLEDL